MIRKRLPFNRNIHAHLLALGYTWTPYGETWEDVGDAENGPAFDEYQSADDYIIIGHDGHFEVAEARDLEREAYEAAMYPDSDGDYEALCR